MSRGRVRRTSRIRRADGSVVVLCAAAVLCAVLAQHPVDSAFTARTSTTGSATAGFYAFDRATITTLAGTGVAGFNGDDQPAAAAQVNNPAGLAVDRSGNLLLADLDNHRIRLVTPAGTISTIAGSGTAGFAGDGGPATTARFNRPRAVVVSDTGQLYIADAGNHRIRRVAADGTISTVAGTGVATYSGDGGPAASAALNAPYQVAGTSDARLYLTDTGNHRIRVIEPDGTIRTVAGTGTGGFSGDGGPATLAQIGDPQALALDPVGNLYLAERFNHRIRRVTPPGTISTVVGTGTASSTGDGGPAATATINGPRGLAVTLERLYLAEVTGQRIRALH